MLCTVLSVKSARRTNESNLRTNNMRYTIRFFVVIASITTFMSFPFDQPKLNPESEMQIIALTDIPSKFKIRGRSGRFLRELAVFEGVWVESKAVEKPEAVSLRFELKSVDDVPCAETVTFLPISTRFLNQKNEAVYFKNGDSVRIRGYEDWTVLQPPAGYFDFTGTPAQAYPDGDCSQLIGVIE